MKLEKNSLAKYIYFFMSSTELVIRNILHKKCLVLPQMGEVCPFLDGDQQQEKNLGL